MRIEIDEVCILKLRENGGFRRDARSERRMLYFPLPPITLVGITFTQINKFAKFYYVSANGQESENATGTENADNCLL